MDNEAPIEVVYKKVKLGKRMLAYFIDIGLFLLASFITFSIINMGITRAPFYTHKQEQLTQLRNESGLYVNGEVITSYVDNESLFPDYASRKIVLCESIEYFYNNSTYFIDGSTIKSEYISRKVKAKTENGVHLFVIDGEILKENNVSDEALFNFYKTEISDYSLAYLMNNKTYFELTRFSFWVSVIEFIIIATIFFTIFFLILPLFSFPRGRQTLGMKMLNIGLISVHADNVTTGRFVGRFFFEFFIMVVLDFFAFLLPAIVSITMIFLTPSNSSLINYVFNDYCVDITDQKIYLNALEREESTVKLQEISIENKDLTLK